MVEMPRVGFARVLAEVGERRRRRGLKAPLMTPPGVDIKSTVYYGEVASDNGTFHIQSK